MATFYSYLYQVEKPMRDWLIENGTGYDWVVQQGQLAEDPNDVFRNRLIHIWVIKDDSFAVMFKMMFSEYLFTMQHELREDFMAKRKALGFV